jgi:hypothetical protein
MFSRFCYVMAKTVVSPELVEVPRAGGAPLPGPCFGVAGEAQMERKVREEGYVMFRVHVNVVTMLGS